MLLWINEVHRNLNDLCPLEKKSTQDVWFVGLNPYEKCYSFWIIGLRICWEGAFQDGGVRFEDRNAIFFELLVWEFARQALISQTKKNPQMLPLGSSVLCPWEFATFFCMKTSNLFIFNHNSTINVRNNKNYI